jgi:hypothetical protein
MGEKGRERDTGARIVEVTQRGQKQRGRPQAPDVCALLRHRLAPNDTLWLGKARGKTEGQASFANTGYVVSAIAGRLTAIARVAGQADCYPSTFPGRPPRAAIKAEKFLPAELATLSSSSVPRH